MTTSLDETFQAAKAAKATLESDGDALADEYTALNKAQVQDEQRVRNNRASMEKSFELKRLAAKKRYNEAIANVAGVDASDVEVTNASYTPY